MEMIHNIKFRAFVYEDESIDDITQAILNILPEAEIEAEEAEGLLEDKIIILSGTVSKKRYTKTFFNTLLEWTDLDKLNADLERKIDEKGNWFLRFDKEDAFDEIWTIKDSGDSIHLKVKIAAFPAKKHIAVDKVREAILND
jgi:RNA binding exosome subunit